MKFLKSKDSIFLLLILLAIVALGRYLYPEFMSDDAFIHIAYAKDISSGNGYGIAGNHTYGSTAPIWPLLIAVVSKLGIDAVNSARALSVIFSCLSISALFYMLRDKLSANWAFALVALFGCNSYFLRWSQTGMESTAACLFAILLYRLLSRELNDKATDNNYFIVGLAPLFRPEFYLFLLILSIVVVYIKRKNFDSMKFVYLFMPIIVWNAFAYFYFGSIVPTTFLAKASASLFTVELVNIIRIVKLIFSGALIEISAIIVALTFLIFKRKSLSITKNTIIETSFLVVLFLSFYGYYILKDVTILSRYSLILHPILFILLANIIAIFSANYPNQKKKISLALASIIVFSFIFNAIFTMKIVKPDADRFVSGFQTEYKKIAEIVKNNSGKNNSIALSDVGIMGAFSESKICDFSGLVDADRFKYKNAREYFFHKRPDFALVRGEIDINSLDSSNVRFYEAYSCTLPSLGINSFKDINVKLYTVEWIEFLQ